MTTTANTYELNDATARRLGHSIYSVWSELAPDIGSCSRLEAAELALDAGRLGQVDPEAEAIVDSLIERYGYDKVLSWVARNCL